jgi:hypothetical protein
MIGLRISKCACMVFALVLVCAGAASAQRGTIRNSGTSFVDPIAPFAPLPGAPKILFIHQEVVTSFPPTGDGVHLGTVRGWINGMSVTNFQFIPDPPPNFHSLDFTLFMDLDGDQILFTVTWQGRIIEALKAPASTVNKARDLMSLTAVFTGFYEVTDATGKYRALLGKKFPCRGMASNAARGPLQPFGASYTEVYEAGAAEP